MSGGVTTGLLTSTGGNVGSVVVGGVTTTGGVTTGVVGGVTTGSTGGVTTGVVGGVTTGVVGGVTGGVTTGVVGFVGVFPIEATQAVPLFIDIVLFTCGKLVLFAAL